MAQEALSDGFVNLCIDPGLNFADGTCRVFIEGQVYDPEAGCPIVPDVLVRVNSARDVDCQFGSGSVLAEAVKKVMCQCTDRIEVYALPRLDAEDGVAAVYTLTVAGTATEDGRATFFMGDADYNIDFRVRAGNTASEIAALLAAEVQSFFPFSVAVSGAVVTFTAKNAGTVGNHLNVIYNWAGRSGFAPAGVTFAFAQTVEGSGDPSAPEGGYASIIGECCYSCYILLSEDTDWQEAMRDHIRSAWACDKPQCFGHGYVYNIGTVGQILATGDNSGELSRLAHSPDDPIFPYLKVASYAALSCCTACTNPELSIQGPVNGLLSCVSMPATCAAFFSYDEMQQLRENGFVVTGPATIGTGSLTNPYIFNDVTNYLYDDLGRENATFRDASSRRLAAATAISIAEKLQEFNGLGLFTRNTAIREGVRGTNPRLMLANIRAWAKDNVGVLFSEFDNIDSDIKLQTDFEIAPRCQGKPGQLHLNMRYRPPVRIDRVNVNLQPALLDNCNR